MGFSQPVIAAQVPAGRELRPQGDEVFGQGRSGAYLEGPIPRPQFRRVVIGVVPRDGGHTFKTVRVSHAVSPTYIPERGNFLFGDDLSSVDIDSEYLHVVWGDNRSGFEGTWYGRVPLSAY